MNLPDIESITLEQVERLQCERRLHDFVEQAWHVVDPESYMDNYHIAAVCEHLQAVTDGQIRKLIINIPPRFGKSLLTAVFWPAWEWGPRNKPKSRWIFATHREDLTLRDSVRCRGLIQSSWYQKRWGDRVSIADDQNQKHRFANSAGGARLAIPVGSALGEGGDRNVVDDPHRVDEVESDSSRQYVVDWYQREMYSRVNNPRTSARVIIMQRLHARDLVGVLLEKKDWELLCLPMEYESTRRRTSIGFVDPRVEPGELLFPERFSREVVDDWRQKLGFAAAGQFQQRPTDAEGGILKRHWWRFYDRYPDLLEMDFIFQSWDMAFKDLKTSSYVVGQAWACKGANCYLLDQVRDKLSFTATISAVRAMSQKWSTTTAKYVEDKANGSAVIDQLKDEIPGLIPVSPGTSSKESRAFAVSPDIEAGNVWLPRPTQASWVTEYIEELAQFPRGAYSDQVDATTQALLMARKRLKRLGDLAPIVNMTQESVFSSYAD